MGYKKYLFEILFSVFGGGANTFGTQQKPPAFGGGGTTFGGGGGGEIFVVQLLSFLLPIKALLDYILC